ncbi:MAG: hypothetical protein GY895_04730 [Phycisphaera sp.]|nr:hypothetical protein [Phycisphaera sp.]
MSDAIEHSPVTDGGYRHHPGPTRDDAASIRDSRLHGSRDRPIAEQRPAAAPG